MLLCPKTTVYSPWTDLTAVRRDVSPEIVFCLGKKSSGALYPKTCVAGIFILQLQPCENRSRGCGFVCKAVFGYIRCQTCSHDIFTSSANQLRTTPETSSGLILLETPHTSRSNSLRNARDSVDGSSRDHRGAWAPQKYSVLIILSIYIYMHTYKISAGPRHVHHAEQVVPSQDCCRRHPSPSQTSHQQGAQNSKCELKYIGKHSSSFLKQPGDLLAAYCCKYLDGLRWEGGSPRTAARRRRCSPSGPRSASLATAAGGAAGTSGPAVRRRPRWYSLRPGPDGVSRSC